jgi:glucose uptake protein
VAQADFANIRSAIIGGVVFNIANILLVAAISIAGMSVAFPVGIGMALVLGVLVNYWAEPVGDATILFLGVGAVVVAILLDAAAYRRLPSSGRGVTAKGLILSVLCGVLMGFFYRFVAEGMSTEFTNLAPGKLGPYSAVFFFSLGLLLSNFLLNLLIMKKPFAGEPVPLSAYFKGNARVHLIGILGGAIWGVGMTFNIIASGQAGFAISYGLGQGATMIAALWGVFIWKEFRSAPRSTGALLALMFVFYFAGLAMIIAARVV